MERADQVLRLLVTFNGEPGVGRTASMPVDVARGYVVGNYGPMWLPTLEVLAQEPFEEGQVVVFRMLNPLFERKANPTPTAILLFARPWDGGWTVAGGGGIGTVAEMDRYAVSCASTWLRFAPDVPTTAAFYRTIEDPRVAALDLETIEGAHFRSNVVGRGSQLVSRWGAEDELRHMGGTGPARVVEELAGLVEGNHGRFGRPRVWVHAQRA